MSDRPECAVPQRDVLEETVTVVQVSKERVLLEGVRRSACGGCSLSSACGIGALAAVFMDRRVLLSIRNDFDAQPGEQVVIGLDRQALARGSLLAYLMPAVVMVAAAMLASAAGLGEVTTVLWSFLVLGVALYATHWLVKRQHFEIAPAFLGRSGATARRHGEQQTLSSGSKGEAG